MAFTGLFCKLFDDFYNNLCAFFHVFFCDTFKSAVSIVAACAEVWTRQTHV